MLQEVAFDFNVTCHEVLTGFKYIADKISELELNQKFICGGEESYGFLISDFVRDKDAVSACCLISEWAASCYAKDSTPYKELLKLYQNYGLYKDFLLSITKKGKEGLEEIKLMMERYRNNPPQMINGAPVEEMRDYLNEVSVNFKTNKSSPIKLPVSDVLQFITEDGTKVTVRPSGTEPKIKFYFAVKTKLANTRAFNKKNKELDLKIQNIINSLQIN